jgi:hypothetical protein
MARPGGYTAGRRAPFCGAALCEQGRAAHKEEVVNKKRHQAWYDWLSERYMELQAECDGWRNEFGVMRAERDAEKALRVKAVEAAAAMEAK